MISSRLTWRVSLVAMLVVLAGSCSSTSSKTAPTTTTAACPTSVDASQLVSTADLKADNEFVAGLGARPTGSAAHQRYVTWIEKQLGTIEGVSVTHHDFDIERTVAESAKLEVRTDGGWQSVPVASAISEAQGTPPNGVTAPLVNIPEDRPITAELATGRIVVRPAPSGEVPQSVFTLPLVTWSTFDPNHTIDPDKPFLGDFLNYNARVEDLAAAHEAGAAGILFVKDLDDRQLADHLEPYEGVPSPTPGVWLGADAHRTLDEAFAADPEPQARLILDTTNNAVTTRSVFATIPGASPARIVIDSHTDGTNVVEDNGPIAMVSMARYFAGLPKRCRPRTIEFAFSTAHFHQRLVSPAIRNGGAEWLARKLDREYDSGRVGAVMVLEHLGSREYGPVPRRDGPGDKLEPTGRPTLQQIFVTPSKPLVATVESVVTQHDLERTIIMKGADVPGETAPEFCNFGGEGTPFNQRLLPTVGIISAPQTLYDPAFGMEGVDIGLMRRQMVAFTELLTQMGHLDQTELAGSVPADRARRAAGAPECPT